MKKAVLFLVEGITDKTSLGHILDRLIATDRVHFEITDGDICTKDGAGVRNIKSAVTEYIKDFLEEKKFKKKDLLEVIHLIDTDGAFVPDDFVTAGAGALCYYTDRIETPAPESIRKRNEKKRGIAAMLASSSEIYGIPYKIFYFSRNLEHVLHNRAETLSNDEKNRLADEFEDKFYGKPEDFLTFINDPGFAAPGDYAESWRFIRDGGNSLLRKCNFHIYFTAKSTNNAPTE